MIGKWTLATTSDGRIRFCIHDANGHPVVTLNLTPDKAEELAEALMAQALDARAVRSRLTDEEPS